MMCDRCGKPIVGKPDTYDNPAPTGAGITLYLHPGWCPASNQQRIPSRPPTPRRR